VWGVCEKKTAFIGGGQHVKKKGHVTSKQLERGRTGKGDGHDQERLQRGGETPFRGMGEEKKKKT